MDEDLPELISRREALQRGLTDHELRTLCSQRNLIRLRSGLYVRSDTDLGCEAQHLARARCVLAKMPVDAALSHTSAALAFGLPVWGVDLSLVHVTRPGATGRKTKQTYIHSAALAPERTCVVEGMRVTDPARTVVDVCRTLPLQAAVVIGDAAKRQLLVTDGTLAALLEESRGRYGNPAARRAIKFLDARSESVGESRSRVLMHRAGVPPPQLQAEVFNASGHWLARVDFLWEKFGVIGEFDGKAKYLRDLPPDAAPGDVVVAEKLREDRLREAGWNVVRWTWSDLEKPSALARRLERGFARGKPFPSRVRLCEVAR
ncbi:hypothetical protein FOS14_20710 [Skermania sp. ID1734]|uniref:hypothetical protein n=1 Tax=Skermania sp. ID1734 TaxID=2597516 RepID=UPI0011806610|nr:hypothetical protein [Skermania sp. ID1734]TSD94441.1 hypothetical protein FOS14_20710 [Skermania sp. ID1734]